MVSTKCETFYCKVYYLSELHKLKFNYSSEAEREASEAEEGAAGRFPRVRVGLIGVVCVEYELSGHDQVRASVVVISLFAGIGIGI